MGHSRMIKWIAQNQDSGIGAFGDTKTELVMAMSGYPDKFKKGDRVMIMRQSPNISNYSKIIIYGQPWTMPTRNDNEFEELLEKSRKEYFRTHKEEQGGNNV